MTSEPTPITEAVGQIVAALHGGRFRYRDEAQLQAGIGQALAAAGVVAAAEVRLAGRDRIDFLAGAVGIEVKVAGRAPDVVRQLRRYAACPQVAALILVTNRARHRGIPAEIGGKPVRVVCLSGVTG